MNGLDVYRDAHIIVVDDEEGNVLLIEGLLRQAGLIDVVGTTDPHQGLELCIARQPDLVILDLLMPGMDGFAFLEAIRGIVPESSYVPVLVLTADVTRVAWERALTAGARDFLTKPFDRAEVLLRVRNLLETRFMYLELQRRNEELQGLVEQRTRELDHKSRAVADLANTRHDLLIQLHEAQMRAPVEDKP